jgi:hypothetical protein
VIEVSGSPGILLDTAFEYNTLSCAKSRKETYTTKEKGKDVVRVRKDFASAFAAFHLLMVGDGLLTKKQNDGKAVWELSALVACLTSVPSSVLPTASFVRLQSWRGLLRSCCVSAWVQDWLQLGKLKCRPGWNGLV